ncbi:MAG TPA: VOC family protein [Phototrophicaceae bacterium]|nr:VOC family protein [Phototrophicaceae bacterium]
MANEITIPILPCKSIDETIAFYVALGFEVTYKQSRPNTYACVKYEDINLHFFTLKGYEPKDSYSTCFVLVPDLAGLHQTFSNGLRSQLGKLPIAGIPRISKLNNANSDKQLRFNIIDPGGNWIRFAQGGAQTAANEDATGQTAGQKERGWETKLSRATHAADWLVEAEGDFERAARMMDKALAEADADKEAASPDHRVQALVLRASLAISLEDRELARTILREVRQIASEVALEEHERDSLIAELQRADDLEKMLN